MLPRFLAVHVVRLFTKDMRAETPHRNALDLLRVIAAWLVLFSHQFVLLGLDEPLWLGKFSWGELGVGIFFFLSGGLVWGSWQRDPHLGRFFARRSLRIFPALAVVVLLSVLVLGPALTSLTWQEYWLADGTWQYFKTLLLNNQKGLPGVFVDNPLAEAVNGSLWSLGPEFLAYLILAAVGRLFLKMHGDVSVLGLLLVTICLLAWYVGEHGVSKPHFEVVVLFGWGACWLQWHWQRHMGASFSRWVSVIVALGLLLCLLLVDGVHRLVLLLHVAVLVSLAYKVTWGQKMLTRTGDLSYGMYIYAFPVQQTLIHFYPHGSFGLHLLFSTLVTMFLAWLSWHGVEKLALRLKPATPLPAH